MVELNQRDRTIKVKIVYYGPALGGKTTNLKVLHERALWSRRGELISVNSRQDRTILCDLLPLKTGGFRGYDLRLQLLAVPGQAIYSMTRRVVIKGADGIVFVANSASDRWNENNLSFKELNANLMGQQLDPASIPLVLQYNKRDLPEVMDVDSLNRGLNKRHAPAFEGVATTGRGVLETFASILTQTIEDLCRRFRTIEMPPGQTVADWTAQAVQGMFGRSRLDEEPKAPVPEEDEALEAEPIFEFDDGRVFTPEPAEHRRVQIAMPEEEVARPPGGTGTSEIRSAESLAESYAEASAELGFVVSDLRDERDLFRSRLDDVRQALDLGEQRLPDEDLEGRVRRVLRMLVRAAGASSATLLLLTSDTVQVLVLPPLRNDPLSRTPWGSRHVEEELRSLAEPRLEEATESPELAEALQEGQSPFDALASVPLRSAERLLALAMLYFKPHVSLPTRETLLHLGFLARVLAGPLEAAAAREAESAAQRLRVLSRATAATVASLLARLHTDAVRRHSVDLRDVLAPLRAPGVSIDVASDAAVLGDPPLLRFALATLIQRCEALALERGQRPVVAVRVTSEEGLVRIRVTGDGEMAVVSGSGPVPDADAELSVVLAIVELHEGGFTIPAEDQDPRFTIDLRPA
jgi:mutual gliding-motility protein MglA